MHLTTRLNAKFERKPLVYFRKHEKAKREWVTPDGMEFIHLIEGEIGYRLGDDYLSLYESDSLFFDGRIPHIKINQNQKIA